MVAYVKSPNGGEILDGLATFEVKWYATKEGAAYGHIELYYSTDGGFTFPYLITNEAANTGSYLWKIPNINASQARIRVKAVGSEAMDDSDRNFIIRQATDYYVDVVSGSNSYDGLSPSSAWKNISYAAANTPPGSTVHAAPGVYDAAAGETFPIYITGESFVSTATGLATIEGAGGGGFWGHTLILENNITLKRFSVNTPDGNWSVYMENTVKPALRNNIISGNAIAIYAVNCSESVIEENKVLGRYGGVGIGAEGGSGAINMNEVRGWTNGSGGYGVGLGFTNGANFVVNKNTVVQNLKGVAAINSSLTIKNNIIASEVGGYSTSETTLGISVEGGTVASTYNDVYANDLNWFGISSGTGDISANAQFIDAAGGDFHLQASSPCIDAGDPDPAYNDPDGSRADMGAYPYYHSAVTTTTTTTTTITTTTTTILVLAPEIRIAPLEKGAGINLYFDLLEREKVVIQIWEGNRLIVERILEGEMGRNEFDVFEISKGHVRAGNVYTAVIRIGRKTYPPINFSPIE